MAVKTEREFELLFSVSFLIGGNELWLGLALRVQIISVECL